MEIKIKKLSNNAIIPTKGSEQAAGWDLYAAEDATIPAGQTTPIPTDLAIQIPFGFFGGIFARSGLATKHGLRPCNCVGVIDADYRGNVIVALHNDSTESREIKKGDRIAQLIVMPFLYISDFIEVNELEDTERGDGGFGSTGTR